MNTFSINEKKFSVPSCWDELTEDQLMRVAQLYMEQADMQRCKMVMLLGDLGGKLRNTKSTVQLTVGDDRYYLSAEQFTQLTSAYDWMFDENGYPDIRRTKMPFDRIGDMYLPGDCLANLTFEQYTIISALCTLDPREQDLAGIISHMVLRKNEHYGGEDSDERQEEREERLKRMDVKKLLCVMFYLTGSVREVKDKFCELFPDTDSDGEKTYRDLFRDNMDLIESLSDGDVTKRDKVRNALMWDVMHSLDQKILLNRQREEREASR